MSKLLRNRWLRWSLFVAALVGLGVGIYQIQPPEPMWEVEFDGCLPDSGPGQPTHFSGDGKSVFAVVNKAPGAGPPNGKARLEPESALQVYDVVTGMETACYHINGSRDGGAAFSEDSRYFAVEIERTDAVGKWVDGKHFLCLIDLQTGTANYAPIPRAKRLVDASADFQFSACGGFLALYREEVDGPFAEKNPVLRIYDTSSAGLLAVRESHGFVDERAFHGDKLVHWVPPLENKMGVEVWSTRERRTLGVLRTTGSPFTISPDAKWLITQVEEERDKYEIWNLDTLKRQCVFRSEISASIHFMISPDSQWFTLRGIQDEAHAENSMLERREFLTGRLLGATVDTGYSIQVPSPDCRFIVTFNPPPSPIGLIGDGPGLKVLDAETLTPIWNRPNAELRGQVLFTSGPRYLIFPPNPGDTVDVFDPATGEVRWTIPLVAGQTLQPFRRTSNSLARGSQILMVAQRDFDAEPAPAPLLRSLLKKLGVDLKGFSPRFSDITIVCDLSSLHERFRLRGWNVDDPLLSDDGEKLVTLHFEGVPGDGVWLRCWEINGFKPLRYAISIPAAFGVAVLLIWKWRQRRAGQTIGPEKIVIPGHDRDQTT